MSDFENANSQPAPRPLVRLHHAPRAQLLRSPETLRLADSVAREPDARASERLARPTNCEIVEICRRKQVSLCALAEESVRGHCLLVSVRSRLSFSRRDQGVHRPQLRGYQLRFLFRGQLARLSKNVALRTPDNAQRLQRVTECSLKLCRRSRPLLVAQLKPGELQLACLRSMAQLVVLALTLSGTVSGPAVRERSLHIGDLSRPRFHRIRSCLSGLLKPFLLLALFECSADQLV